MVVARAAQVRLRLWFVGAGRVVGDYEQSDQHKNELLLNRFADSEVHLMSWGFVIGGALVMCFESCAFLLLLVLS